MNITRFANKLVQTVPAGDVAAALKDAEAVLWVDITGPTDEGLQLLSEVFQFHPLTIEDVRHQGQRPKVEEFADYLFITLNPIISDWRSGPLFRELFVFIGNNFLVTVHPAHEPSIQQAHQRLDPSRYVLPVTPSYLLYVLMDVVVDAYAPAFERLEEDIEQLSTDILTQPKQEILNQLFSFKHQLSHIWRILWPQRDIINVLINHPQVFINQNSQYYLRDVADHLQQSTDMVAVLRDTINTLINLYVSAVSNQLNRVVNRLTVFAIFLGVLTVFSGFYGMNFAHTWPPFAAPWSVPLILGLMLATTGTLYAVFRRLRWL